MPMDDVREVSNYVAALDHGLARLAEGFPLSLLMTLHIEPFQDHLNRATL